ncbi:hypothetical protein NQ176_g842 [Zarea fungicola]|uniref:Uncharacterized protein n=1 Tax=Zarea fungicola TaxID=93591 RepID=A0ACC1NVB7_9HYPO|nr:hypothetical protein NQ176_g842 [Lecanicillium fungicola]
MFDAMTESSSLANVVVCFAVIGNPPDTDIWTLAENHRFHFTPPEEKQSDGTESERWRGGQEDSFTDVFAFKFQEHIHSPQGWVAGSSPTDDCDFRLAENNQSGISRFHFCIDISTKNRPRIKNMCRNAIRIHDPASKDSAILEKDDGWDIEEPVDVDLGVALLRMWRPTLIPEEEATYRSYAHAFHKDYMHAVLKPTSAGAAPTLNHRFGHGNAVYQQLNDQQPRNGTFGSVIKVMELRKRKSFAAKIPHVETRPSAVADRRQWETIRDEFHKLMQLRHENIVETIDILPGNTGIEPPWLIMEWVERNLNTYRPSDREIPLLLCQISAGLAYMHSKGFTHRDLKPDNILIQENGTSVVAKIADVGLAKYAGDRNMHTYAGTLLYMAPELWDSEKGYTNAVDMWSFGIIALELLTNWDIKDNGPEGRGGPPSETLHRKWIQTYVLPRRDEAHEETRELLNGLLSVDVQTRWTALQCKKWLGKARDSLESSFGEENRNVRSANPTLSTTRAQSLPNTEPWGSSVELSS